MKYQMKKTIGQQGSRLLELSEPQVASTWLGFHFLNVNSLWWVLSFSFCIYWAITVIVPHGTYSQLMRVVPMPGARSLAKSSTGLVSKYCVL